MANIIVTSSINSIEVDFGAYSSSLVMAKAVWRKNDVHFNLKYSSANVDAVVYNANAFAITFDGSTGTLQVDSVDGVSPSSNSDLYDKLIALLA